MNDLALAIAAVLLVAAVVADLLLSPRYVRRVRALVAAGDRRARSRMYALTVSIGWTGATIALVLLLAGGLSLADVGFRLPDPGSMDRWAGPLVGAGIALGVGTALARRGAARPLAGDVEVLLPTTSRERRWYAAVAVTAGITEEVVYRALALTVLLALLPGGRWPAIVVAAVMFGLGHVYQGVAGVLVTAGLAVALGLLYLHTGSLLPGIVVHALLDLRILLLPAPAPSDDSGGAATEPGRAPTAP